MKRRVTAAVLCVLALAAGVVLVGREGAGRRDTEAINGTSYTGSVGVRRSVAYLQSHHVRVPQRPATTGEVGAARAEAGAVTTGGGDVREKPEPREGFPQRRPHAGAPLQRVGEAAVSQESSLSAGTSFLGASSSVSGFIPPDSMGAVGPTQVLVSVNGRIRLYDKQGNLVTCAPPPGNPCLNLTDSDFWSTLLPANAEPTDPGVEYDRLAQRWIVSAVDIENTDNLVMLAVSSGPTITDKTSFTFFSFHESLGGTQRFADYPQLGVDANAVYVGVNLFTSSSGSFAGTSAYVIQKSSVLGAGPIHVTGFPLAATSASFGPDSPQPATDMDPNVGAGYIVGPDNLTANQLDVRRVTNPGSLTPTISADLPVTIPATAQPLAVPAQGTTGGLDALDDRLFEAMIARGPSGTDTLWTAHNIRVNSSGIGTTSGDRDGSRWYQLGTLGTTPSLVQSGTLFDTAASSPQYFWIPSIAMNGQGHASLNSSVAGSGRFAQIAASGRLASDPSGTTELPDIVQSSTSTYNLGSGTPKRWGDYSQTVVDPTDNMTFWTFQEYANATNSWGLRVIKLQPPPPAIPASATPSTVAAGQAHAIVNITGTSSNGSGFFDPGTDAGGPGFPNHISAAVSGGVVVNSVTYVDPTQLTLDLNTVGVSNGGRSVTITNPDGQTASCAEPLVIGTDSTVPSPPNPQGTTPASPSTSTTPLVFGTNSACGSTVKLYTDNACSTLAASGSAAVFGSPGIPVTVPPNSSTDFYARATDVANNTSPCSGTHVTYIEDSIPPTVSVDSGPTGTTTDTSPTFTFSGSDAVGPVTFQCSIDTGTASFGACSGPGNSDTPASPLADGSYTFRVRATDGAGNSAIATRSFTVQTTSGGGGGGGGGTGGGGSTGGGTTTTTPTNPNPANPKNPPDTSFTKAPKKTHKLRPKFKFTANEAGVTFRCKLDAGSFVACSSPFRPPKLTIGRHVLRVEAVDSAGAVDPSPAVSKFRVLPPA
jgi:hypothetical protein